MSISRKKLMVEDPEMREQALVNLQKARKSMTRPNKKEIRQAKHYLYGLISVKKYFSAGDWLKETKKKINLCIKKKKIPIVVVGTGLYFNTITKGISKIPDIDLKTRNKVRNLFKKIGFAKFYVELLKLDPKVKNKILATDSQRTQRAFEVKLKTKKSLVDWIKNTKSDFTDYDLKKVFIDIPRDELLKKISKRTELMFKHKCINEVKKFLKLKIRKDQSVNKVIGIAELTQYLNHEITLEEAEELISIKTRQYAKRQVTWARTRMVSWVKIDPSKIDGYIKKLKKSSLNLDQLT